jgi:hypothetical protein
LSRAIRRIQGTAAARSILIYGGAVGYVTVSRISLANRASVASSITERKTAMSMLRKWVLATLIAACGPWSVSQAGVFVGVGCGGPGFYRPYGCGRWGGYGWGGYGWGGYGFYRPYGLGVVVAPPPVVVSAPPVVVQQPTVVQPAYTPPPPPAPLPMPTPSVSAADYNSEVTPAVAVGAQGDFNAVFQQLRDGDEQGRAEAAVRLGRLRAERAVGPLVKALNSDGSAKVREAAARGLGLIGSTSSLSALQYAAQADDDREVRHSAAFAAETIRGNLPRR